MLDVAGSTEASRKANREQNEISFEVAYIGASPNVLTSVGLGLEGIARRPPMLRWLFRDQFTNIAPCLLAGLPVAVSGRNRTCQETGNKVSLVQNEYPMGHASWV